MFCSNCGVDNQPGVQQCAYCGEPLSSQAQQKPAQGTAYGTQHPYQPPQSYVPPRPMEDDPAMRAILPIGQSPLAIIAGYLGLISLGICFLGPFAVIVGILALVQISKNPRMHGSYRAIIGIVLGAISSFAMLLFFVLVLMSEG